VPIPRGGSSLNGGTIPEPLFFAFQMTLAIIIPALIGGANVERIGFGFVMLFSSLWMLLCHVPVTHWVWSGGWLGRWASCTKKRRDPDGGSRLT